MSCSTWNPFIETDSRVRIDVDKTYEYDILRERRAKA
jgi:hypothetical protein